MYNSKYTHRLNGKHIGDPNTLHFHNGVVQKILSHLTVI